MFDNILNNNKIHNQKAANRVGGSGSFYRSEPLPPKADRQHHRLPRVLHSVAYGSRKRRFINQESV